MENAREKFSNIKEAREMRYEKAKNLDGLPESLNLTQEEWAKLPSEDRQDIEEFFLNAHAEVLSHQTPFDKLLEAATARREVFHKIAERVPGSVRDILQQYTVAKNQGLITDAQDDLIFRRGVYTKLTKLGFDTVVDFGMGGVTFDSHRASIDVVKSAISEQGSRFFNGEDVEKSLEELESTLADLASDNPPSIKLEMLSVHDGFHVLDKLGQTGGVDESPRFLKAKDERESVTNPEILLEELYPGLFLTGRLAGDEGTLPIMLQSAELRRKEAEAVRDMLVPQDASNSLKQSHAEMVELLFESPKTTPEERLKDYEKYMCNFVLSIAVNAFEGVDEESIRSAFASLTPETRPAHYQDFAMRVFADNASDNPRLFVDEVLQVIRRQS